MSHSLSFQAARIRGALRAAIVIAMVSILVVALPSEAGATVVKSGPRWSAAVALTFDDGWGRDACASISNTLRRYRATGTFFINGNYLKAAPYRWRQILRGHEIGNHTRSHRNLVREPNGVVIRQIRENEVLHERILRRPMLKVLRPPYGSHNARVRSLAARLGYRRTVLWNVDTFDWKRSATVSSVIARATGARAGSVILMHCGPSVTPRALASIIRHYRARGIKLAGLKQVLGL